MARGPLAERDFRLLFAGRTVSALGNSFANIALAFAVLDLTGSKADLGLVLAARVLPMVVFMLVGGIWADRLPRSRVMVFSNLVSAATQAVVAALLFSGTAEVWQLVVLAALNGTAGAFFFPASSGIVPQTVPEPLLQQANAALRLGLNSASIVGAALGGLVVGLTSPATGIAVDAASFLLSALLVSAIRLSPALRLEATNFLADLALGWREFSSRMWLWVIVIQFGFVNAIELGAEGVLGPAVAKEHLHGAIGWGLVLTADAIGLIGGGLLLLRVRPRRLLLTATLGFLLTVPFLFGLAIPLPLAGVAALALVAGFGAETFGVLWDTTMQQEIPQDRLSRVYSYDALGSFALIPLGLAAAGPIAEAVGTEKTLFAAGLISLGATVAVLFVRDVRTLQRRAAV
ncbi:MAG TPA: MFS transporter [Gaiellaceae bacterium]|nr:MFS transporter [Gaiellaceae bacterium]